MTDRPISLVVTTVPGGRVMLTSPEVPGLMVAGATREEVIRKMPAALRELRQARAVASHPDGGRDHGE